MWHCDLMMIIFWVVIWFLINIHSPWNTLFLQIEFPCDLCIASSLQSFFTHTALINFFLKASLWMEGNLWKVIPLFFLDLLRHPNAEHVGTILTNYVHHKRWKIRIRTKLSQCMLPVWPSLSTKDHHKTTENSWFSYSGNRMPALWCSCWGFRFPYSSSLGWTDAKYWSKSGS